MSLRPWFRVATLLALATPGCETDALREGGGGSETSPAAGSDGKGDEPGMDTTGGTGGSGDQAPDAGTPGGCELPAGSPPTIERDGVLHVPIDVVSVDAQVVFDLADQSATASAEMRFIVGPSGGKPLFDLRQTIRSVALDGVDLGAQATPVFLPSDDDDERLRTLDEELAACSEHTLRIEYDFAVSDAQCSVFPYFYGDAVTWFDYANDFQPGCFIEQWIPANLPHDQFAASVEIALEGTQTPHDVVTNGTTVELGDNHWQLDFPARFTSMSPMIVVMPVDELEHKSTEVQLPDGHTVTLELYRTTDFEGENLADIEAVTAESLRAVNLELGEYVHGDRYVLIASPYNHEMEYDGATSTSFEAIPHEVFHAWVGRGLKPLTTRDSWIDEGWTTFYNEDAFEETVLEPSDAPVTLAPDNPWLRATDEEAYDTGSEVWATLADAFGLDELRGLLRSFYMQHAGAFVTTEQLERFLFCETNDERVRFTFHRFVYGRTTELPEPPANYCD